MPTMRFKLRSVERRRNLRTKEVCLDKSICRRPLPFSVEEIIKRNRKKAMPVFTFGEEEQQSMPQRFISRHK